MYIYISIYMVSPRPIKTGGGGVFFRTRGGYALSYGHWEGLLHMGHMAGVTRGFPGGGLVPIYCPNCQMQDEVYKSL